jgi:hypothetical protein
VFQLKFDAWDDGHGRSLVVQLDCFWIVLGRKASQQQQQLQELLLRISGGISYWPLPK